MRKNVKVGRVVEEKKYSVMIGNKKYEVPEACVPSKQYELEAIAGEKVEVLLSTNNVVAIRVPNELAKKLKIGPIITCYIMPPDIIFDYKVMAKVQPAITKALVDENILDDDVAEQLNSWQKIKK